LAKYRTILKEEITPDFMSKIETEKQKARREFIEGRDNLLI